MPLTRIMTVTETTETSETTNGDSLFLSFIVEFMDAKLATPLLTTTTMTAAAATMPTKKPMKLDHFPLSVQRVLGKQQRREFVWDKDPEAKAKAEAEAEARGGVFERRSSTEA